MQKQIPPSPPNGLISLSDNDLGYRSDYSRDKEEPLLDNVFLSGNSLYDILRELSERKKMHFFKPLPLRDYKACSLCTGKVWYIYFYVTNPETGKLKRIRIRVDRVKNVRERKKVARELMAAINERLALGWNPLLEKKAPRAHVTLQEALDAFLETKRKETEASTMRCYNSFVKILRNWLAGNGVREDIYASSFTKQAALSFMDYIGQDRSPKSYNNAHTFYNILWRWMGQKGYAASNPFEDIPKKSRRLIKKNRRIFTDEELNRLFAFLKERDEAYLAMCLLCYCCFIRPKEIALLRCKDINLDKQVVFIGSDIAKNDKESYRTIPDDILPVLAKIDLSHPDWFVFSGDKRCEFMPGKVKVCSRRITQWWDQNVRPALCFGMELKFYSLKDTGITNMLGHGIPINYVQQQADHSSVAMTAIYVGKTALANEALREVDILPHSDGTQ